MLNYSKDEVILSLQDLIVLYCLVHYRDDKIRELISSGFSPREAERAASTLGIAEVWGNKRIMVDANGNTVQWDGKSIPDGSVNRFIMRHNIAKMAPPLMYATQFYRVADKLYDAGFLKGDEYRFVTTDAAEIWVRNTLDRITDPRDWFTYVPVQNGMVKGDKIQPKTGVALRLA